MNSTESVPIVSGVADVYPAAAQDSQKQRWEHLLATFEQTYGAPAEFISRSPGRVNIIGEHIDYMLFSVLPMAIEADVLLAVRVTPETSTIKITNVLNDKFPAREFEVPEGDLEIDSSQHEWSNYFKSGYRGAIELLRKKGVQTARRPPGMQILATGNVPAGGGLSSSAAFVCASALAGMRSMGVEKVDKKELVTLAVVSERYVGVNSGGMDQSASVLGVEGSAIFISFLPTLTAAPVAFPKTTPEPVFLIANTLKVSNKHVTGPIQYNLRVVETTLAAEVLARKLSLGPLPSDAGPLGTTLKTLMDVYFSKSNATKTPQEKFEEIESIADKELAGAGYKREELAEILGMSVDELVSRYMTKFPIRAEKFQLRARALHVFREAARVVKFYTLLEENAGQAASEDILVQLGELMNASQKDCRTLYDCSCEELDELCKLAIGAGSYGSRLTGAGWGGCSVHLVPQDKAEAVKQAWLKDYYGKRYPDLPQEKLDEAIVVSKPGSGSVLMYSAGKA